MLAGSDAEHDLLVGEDGGDGVDPAREGLAEGDNVGLDAVPFTAEPGGREETSIRIQLQPCCDIMRSGPWTYIFPVRASPVWISSHMNKTLCRLQIS